MLFLKSLPIFTALLASIGITVFIIIASCTMTTLVRKNKEKKVPSSKAMALRILEITFAMLMGFSIADTGMIAYQTLKALQHGMAREPETAEENANQYINTLQQVIVYNKITHECADINENDDLTGKTLIYVRFDCPDCHAMFLEMPEPNDDVLYISSRTDIGHAIMDKYDIMLTEVPSAVYISKDENVYIQPLGTGTGDELHFNIEGWQEIISLQYADKEMNQ